MNTTYEYKSIIESLRTLSLPFDEQVKCFPAFVDVPFEVLDDFDNAIILSPKVIESGKLDYHVIADLIRLHNLIEFTARNPAFKDLEEKQFSEADEWNRVRKLAKELLLLMGEK